jgi:hypothetical protein
MPQDGHYDCPHARHHADWPYIVGAWTAQALLSSDPYLHLHWLDDDRHWDTSLIRCSLEPKGVTEQE